MVWNRRGKPKQTTRKERNVLKTTQDMATNTADDKEFSDDLSRFLDYFVVNENLIQFRRKMMFCTERQMTLSNKAYGLNRRTYIFGSQMEGTTIIGIMSDADFLHCFDTFRLFLDSENPPLQPHNDQVVLTVSTNGCASQYCVLTMIEPSTQARLFQKLDHTRDPLDIVRFFQRDWTTTNGKIPHTVMFDTLTHHPLKLKESYRHGPAESIRNMDHVCACYCQSLPKQCKFVFERPRPGHWPSEKTLKKAKKCGVFIVPQGPPNITNIFTYDNVEKHGIVIVLQGLPKRKNICPYDNFDYQWRISTNLTERLFMFSLDILHLKAYVVTKMIRKVLFAPEYRDRLSTFHFKTAFFFAVENTRSDVWREDNLINCVKYILTTLRRFFTRRICPHFTIENVNLFDGKIERHEFPKLVDRLTYVINSDILTYVINSWRRMMINIRMDNIPKTLSKCTCFSNYSAIFVYVFNMCHGQLLSNNGFKMSEAPVYYRKALCESQYTRLQTYYRAPLEKYRKYEYFLHSVMSCLASELGSVYIEEMAEGCEYNHDGINKARQMYSQSLESNIIGNHMRFASFLFCNGEYDEACTRFEFIEDLIQEDKKSNFIYQFFVSPSESLALQIAKQSSEHTSKQRLSVFLMFGQEEALCVPGFLRCELYRGRFGNLTSSSDVLDSNNECLCVQIEPYLYYLQYLTYRELKQQHKKSEALTKLFIFTELIKSSRLISSKGDEVAPCGFFDTSLNMLGHCFELEQKWESAWKTYKTSLQLQPQSNASVLHIIRLVCQVVQSLRT